MRIVSPVIRDAALEARNTTTPATSIGSPNAVQRGNAFYYVRPELRIGEATLRPRSTYECWCDRIHSDVVLPPLNGEAFGQMCNGGLRHAVHRFGRQCNEPRLGTQVDDVIALLPDHDAPGSLTSEKCSLQIDGKRQIKVLLTYVLRKVVGCESRIVDQDVDPSEMLYHVINSLEISDRGVSCPSVAE